MTIKLPDETRNRLNLLAKATKHSRVYLATRAIEDYLDVQEWQVQAIREAIQEADSPGARFRDHDEVLNHIEKMVEK